MVDYRTVLGRLARVALNFKHAWLHTRPSGQDSTNDRPNADTVRIFVGNLPFAIDDKHLRSLFQPYGPVASVSIITDRTTGGSRGFGFVEMPSQTDARSAITAMNGREIDGRSLIVDSARSRGRHASAGGSRDASARRSDSHGRDSRRYRDRNRRQQHA